MSAPVESREIAVTGDPGRARTTVAQALESRGFTVVWHDEWSGSAEKGSRGRQLLLGGFAPHLQVDVSLHSFDRGTAVRLTRPSLGVSGGLLGRAKAAKQLGGVTDDLTEVFRKAGVLLDPTG